MLKILQLLFEFALGGAVLVFVYWQMIRPLFRGTPIFPMFRRRPRVERELEVVNEQMEDADLRRQLEARQRQLGEESPHTTKEKT